MRTVLTFPLSLFSASLVLLSACGEASLTSADDGGVSSDAAFSDGAPMRIECDLERNDCARGFICIQDRDQTRCVRDPDPPPPGDGSDCRPCPAPGECRQGVCIQPNQDGTFCEFDHLCRDDAICIAGRCTDDPRRPSDCREEPTSCGGATECGEDGVCNCEFDTDCPLDLVCDEHQCLPEESAECVADLDCGDGRFCDGGRCRGVAACEVSDPSLVGEWDVTSVLNMHEVLPEWVADFLAAVDRPFRFLAGDETCIDFGLADWIEAEICALVRPFVDRYLPEWSRDVFRAIADLDYVFGRWTIEERMTLVAGETLGSYRGTREWVSIEFDHRGEELSGGLDTIRSWRFSPAPFNASAVCGTFSIERHEVHLSVGALITWLLDTLVEEASGGRWTSAEGALDEMAAGFCSAFAELVGGEVDSVTDPARIGALCSEVLSNQIDRALSYLVEVRLGVSPLTLRGSAPIVGPNSLRPGQWSGQLFERSFTGNFDAVR